MRILIVENITPEDRGGNQNKWKEETETEFGLAAYDDFDLIIGMTEDAECPILSDKVGMGLIEVETIMAKGE